MIITTGRCKGVKSVGKREDGNISGLEMGQSQNCKSPFLGIFSAKNNYQNPNLTTKELFRR